MLNCVAEHLGTFKDRDAIFFIDNEGGCSSLIRGSTSAQDVSCFIHAVHALLTSVNCRAWFEWVDSESNPADGLSRLGLHDPWTARQGWQLANAAPYVAPNVKEILGIG